MLIWDEIPGRLRVEQKSFDMLDLTTTVTAQTDVHKKHI